MLGMNAAPARHSPLPLCLPTQHVHVRVRYQRTEDLNTPVRGSDER